MASLPSFSPASIVSRATLDRFFGEWWATRARNIGGSVSGTMAECAISTYDGPVGDRDMPEFIEYVYEAMMEWCEARDIDE